MLYVAGDVDVNLSLATIADDVSGYVKYLKYTNLTGGIMIISTINHIPNKKIVTHHGVVSGSTVKAKHAGSDFLAGIKNFFGGEISTYTDLLESAREVAVSRMIEQAEEAGANAVVNTRMATSAITAGAAEVYVYGTAVVVE